MELSFTLNKIMPVCYEKKDKVHFRPNAHIECPMGNVWLPSLPGWNFLPISFSNFPLKTSKLQLVLESESHWFVIHECDCLVICPILQHNIQEKKIMNFEFFQLH